MNYNFSMNLYDSDILNESADIFDNNFFMYIQDERSRIESLGGCVLFFGGWRVNGSLAVSRSIGDSEQKPFITGEPDVEEYEMEGLYEII